MPHENDSAVLDSARLHTRRLMQALQYGHQPVPVRRSLPLLVASLVADRKSTRLNSSHP